jgi:hypothetical protein
VQDELAGFERRAQLFGEAQSAATLAESLLVERIWSGCELGPVHRDVGALDQTGTVRRVGGRQRNAYVCAELGTYRLQRKWLLEARADPLCDAHRLGGIRVHHHNAELVAPDSGHNVTGRERSGEALTELSEDLIAGGMAEGVVDLLEMLEIDEQERQAPLWPRGRLVGKEAVENAEQIPSVPEPGQMIGHGEVLALLRQHPHGANRRGYACADEHQRSCGQSDRYAVHPVERAHEQDHEATRRGEARKQKACRLPQRTRIRLHTRQPHRP